MSNLPPGCSVRDLPGNDDGSDDEAFANAMYERFAGTMPEENLDALVEWLCKLRADAYAAGYKQCMDDAAEAAEIMESERLAAEYWAQKKD